MIGIGDNDSTCNLRRRVNLVLRISENSAQWRAGYIHNQSTLFNGIALEVIMEQRATVTTVAHLVHTKQNANVVKRLFAFSIYLDSSGSKPMSS